MPTYNADISKMFDEVADLLEIEAANPFRVRAYRDAARTVGALSRPVAELIAEGEDLTKLNGIGEDLAGKIEEIVETGGLEQLEKLKAKTPLDLADMLDLKGLGPKRVQQIHAKLDVDTLDELQQAAAAHKIRGLDGFGPKTENKVLNQLKQKGKAGEERTLFSVAEEVAKPLVAYLKGISGVTRVEVAGSYRRRKETVGDLDILVIGEKGGDIIDHFVEYEDVQEVVSQGDTRSTIILRTGMQVDLRVVVEESYGSALFYFTGSKGHNLHLRNIAIDQDLKVNEYGVFRGEKHIAGETEREIYELFKLDYVVPELREDRGEFDAARQGELPELVTLDDIRGDLQSHTTASDGHNSLDEMAQAAQERGYDYLALTDHSRYVGITQGLDADELAKRLDEIDAYNDDIEDFRVLKGLEMDIQEDGSLAFSGEVLNRLDLLLIAIHTKFSLARSKQTERIIRAMDNPHANIFVHPTGRRIGERPPYDIDMERVIEAALERGCFLEVNAQPSRLDLNDIYAKLAKDMGLKLAISTDAHSTSELDYMRFGVGQACRGWLETDDVINTRSWRDLIALLKR